MLVILFALLFRLARLFRAAFVRTRYRYWRLGEPQPTQFRSQPKPPWVRQEVIRLKALMREAGRCRAIEKVFNRRFAAKRNMTVGRTWVNETIRKHQYEIEVLRRQIKNAKPRPVPRNLVWGVDLTGKTTLDGRTWDRASSS
ncbi:MAG: hypothetical protein WD118_11935 [Phycisphaeraceae bacterium]